ncbi:MAG: uracil-DNA glycosylase family protein [Bacteroidota bacterium]
MTFAEQVLQFHFQTLQPNWQLPDGVELIFPFDKPATQDCMRAFYSKYFSDDKPRIFVLGINPGRFGAGVTGVPFTGPVRLIEKCGIHHPFPKKGELSADFIYRWIAAMGGPDFFYRNFYITSVCPLGFIRQGKNYNYYDSKKLERAVTPHIINNLNTQLAFGSQRHTVLCLGEGKNYRFLDALNNEHNFFSQVIPLPHPRYVMQYKRKSLQDYLDRYVSAAHEALN